MIDQAVLRRDFGRGIAGNTAADPVGLNQRMIHPGPGQPLGAQKPRQSAAYDQHIRFQFAVQLRKFRQVSFLFPNRFDHIHHRI